MQKRNLPTDLGDPFVPELAFETYQPSGLKPVFPPSWVYAELRSCWLGILSHFFSYPVPVTGNETAVYDDFAVEDKCSFSSSTLY